jgi:hypothetical protein
MVKITFEADKLAIAYIMQLRGIRDFGISTEKWNVLFGEAYGDEDKLLIQEVQMKLNEEYAMAENLRQTVEKEWRLREENVLAWLRELAKIDFREPIVRVCVVPFGAGITPFMDIPLIIVGKIRKGWGYPETIGHELAHILFNQNFRFKDELEHPYVQLIEEEIAVRLGVRARYFDYEIPAFAGWVRKAQHREKVWRRYLQHIKDFKDIGQFIRENEG